MKTWLRIVLWSSVPVIGVIGELGYVRAGFDPQLIILDASVGIVTMSAGLVLWSRRPNNSLGLLLFAAGVAWSLSGLNWYGNSLLFAIGGLFMPVHFSILLHVLLAYPDGRLRSRVDRTLVAIVYGNVALFALGHLSADPRAMGIPVDNAFYIIHVPGLFLFVDELLQKLFVAESVAAVAILVARWRRTTPAARGVYAPVVASALFLLAAKATEFAARWIGAPPQVVDAFATLTTFAKLGPPIAFLLGLLRSRFREAGVGEFLIELDLPSPRVALRDALARALHDPTVEVAYWLTDRRRFVDTDGNPVELPSDRHRRAVTLIQRGGAPLGAIIHDSALLEEPRLLEAASRATQLAIENERLQAEVRATLEEVRASRARIVEAGDAERRRVERDLHDGAQQRLLSLSLALGMARGHVGPDGDPALLRILDETQREASEAIVELRELARGIHPSVLTEEGLGPAIESLVERAVLPVAARVPEERYSASIEATAYFLVSEALTNIAKYAQATRATVGVARRDGTLVVEVTDDGVGGADPTLGSGLRGLGDRVAAVGGRLVVDSPPERGTRIRAVLPCG